MSHLLYCYSLWRFWLVKNHLSSLRKRRFSTWKAKAILPRSCGSPVSGRSVPWLPCAEDGRYGPRQGQNRVGRVNPGPPHANSRLFLRRAFNAPFLSFHIATACKDSRQYGTWKMARLYFPSQHFTPWKNLKCSLFKCHKKSVHRPNITSDKFCWAHKVIFI